MRVLSVLRPSDGCVGESLDSFAEALHNEEQYNK